METKINNVNELEPGDMVVYNSPFGGEKTAGSVMSKFKTNKYPITSDGVKGRNEWVNDRLTFISAKSENCVGDEMIMEVCIMDEMGASLTLKEIDDFSKWEIYKISKDHPKYNPKIAKQMKAVESFFSEVQKAVDFWDCK